MYVSLKFAPMVLGLRLRVKHTPQSKSIKLHEMETVKTKYLEVW